MAACGAPSTPYVTTIGALRAGETMRIRVASATLNVYAPEKSQKRNLFTISATAMPKGTPPPPPSLRPDPHGVAVTAPNPLAVLLVRVPDRVDLDVASLNGDVNVTDVTGNARVIAGHGNVSIMLPGYAQASVNDGNIQATMGSMSWPGTLRFFTGRGDVELRINPSTPMHVHLHTGNGTLFTDFALTGTSSGPAETIDATINGGGRGIDVETTSGSIRLLRLQPQP